jgi:O-antigen ligase
LVFKFSFPKAFIYASLPLLYVSLEQTHPILVIPAKAIISNQYWEGRHLTYGFSPHFFITIVALLLIFYWRKNLKKFEFKDYQLAAIAFVLCGFLSAFYASLMPNLSSLSVFGQVGILTFFWYVRALLMSSSQFEKQKFLITLFLILSSLIIYESLFVLKQTLSQSPVGLAIEATQFAPVFGLGSDESGSFRPFGLQAHPNGLANQQLVLLSSVFLIFAYLQKKYSKIPLQKILLFISVLAVTNIVLSLSRAAFVAIFAVFILLWVRHRGFMTQINQTIQKKLFQIPNRYKIIIILILGFLFFRLSNRLLYSVYSFSEFGGVNTRAIQYAEALEVFKKSPFFGIGDSMFIPTSYQLFPQGVMTYFPEEVHSGLLLMLIERGLLGGIVYLIFMLFLLKKIKKTKLHSSTKSVLYSGLIVGLVMMFFHPEKNFFSLFVLLTMAILENKNDYKFTK